MSANFRRLFIRCYKFYRNLMASITYVRVMWALWLMQALLLFSLCYAAVFRKSAVIPRVYLNAQECVLKMISATNKIPQHLFY